MARKPLNQIHYNIMSYCYNPKISGYETVGARGIKVCEEWHDRENFRNWALNNGYKEGLYLERIDKSKDFDPSNCKFGITMARKGTNERKRQKIKMHKELKEMAGIDGNIKDRLYRIYYQMLRRCYNPNSDNYKYYGGRGIGVCEEWKQKHGVFYFMKWAKENGYKDGLTIERKDVDGDYCPENCEWITSLEQQSNKRVNTFIEYGGKKQTAAQWARELGIGKDTITYRVRVGWTAEECLFGKEKNVSNCRPRMEIPDYLRNDDNEK